MQWYLAKLVFRIVCGDGVHTAQFDEQLRLVTAPDKQEAFRKAQAMGRQEEDVFVNDREQLVQWKFVNVSELYRLHELIDGAEVYSRIEEQENAEVYMHNVHQKAENIFFSPVHQLLNLA